MGLNYAGAKRAGALEATITTAMWR